MRSKIAGKEYLKFWCKVFVTKYDFLVAICDEDILEKVIRKKPKVVASKKFYGGKLVNGKIAVRLMEKATIGNLLGKNIVGLAIKNGFIVKDNVIIINGVPHAQFVKI